MHHPLMQTFHVQQVSRWQMEQFLRFCDLYQFFHPGGTDPVQRDLVGYAYRHFGLHVARQSVTSDAERDQRLLRMVLGELALEKTHHLYVLHSQDHPMAGCCCLIKCHWEAAALELLEEFDLKRQRAAS